MTQGLSRGVTYHRSWDEQVYVERLASVRQIREAAPELCGLILRAYSHAYETDDPSDASGLLTRGTVATQYGRAHHRRFRDKAVEHFLRGSQTWVVRDNAGSVAAFAKVTPGEALVDPRPGTVYINDVVTDPGNGHRGSQQRKGYGRTALHAALKFGDFPDVPVWLEAFEASEDQLVDGYIVPGRNRLYRNMGLERVSPTEPVDPFTFPNDPNEAQLWMCEFRTTGNVAVNGAGVATLNDITRVLETRYPDLQRASVRA